MTRRFPIFVWLLVISACSGCASLFNGTSEAVHISTHPEAEIYIDGQFLGTGQRTLKLTRSKYHEIRVVKETCEQRFVTQRSFNKTALFGLFMDFGLFSLPIDFSTGAAWNIVPNQLHMQPECMNQIPNIKKPLK